MQVDVGLLRRDRHCRFLHVSLVNRLAVAAFTTPR